MWLQTFENRMVALINISILPPLKVLEFLEILHTLLDFEIEEILTSATLMFRLVRLLGSVVKSLPVDWVWFLVLPKNFSLEIRIDWVFMSFVLHYRALSCTSLVKVAEEEECFNQRFHMPWPLWIFLYLGETRYNYFLLFPEIGKMSIAPTTNLSRI